MPENVSIRDESSIHRYRTEIPNIIFELGLKANELALYLAIKRSAGDGGKCTKSSSKLAQECGISKKLIPKIRESLCQKFDKINKPLISCSHRVSEFGDNDTCCITIIDIWPENNKYFEGGGRVKTTLPREETTLPRVKTTLGRVKTTLPPQKTTDLSIEKDQKGGRVKTTLPRVKTTLGRVKTTHKEYDDDDNKYHHPLPSSKTGDLDLTDDFHSNKDLTNNQSIEEKIHIFGDIYFSKPIYDQAIQIKGSHNAVKYAVEYIQKSPKRTTEINNWLNTLKNWKVPINVDTKENEKMAKEVVNLVENNSKKSGWLAQIYHDKKKDQKGILILNSMGYGEQVFIAYVDPEFKSKLQETLSIKNMIVEQKKVYNEIL